jgi:PAS domain S-box-containing protein
LQELVARIIEAVPGGVVHIALDGSVLHANAEAARIFGIPLRNLSDCGAETFHEDGSPCPPEASPVARVFATAKPDGPRTIGIRHLDGIIVWAVVRAVPVFDAKGELDGAVVTFLDITERKRAEEELRRSEERWRSLASNIPDFVVIADRDTRLVSLNRVTAPHDEADVIGTRLLDWVDEGSRGDFLRAFEQAIEDENVVR